VTAPQREDRALGHDAAEGRLAMSATPYISPADLDPADLAQLLVERLRVSYPPRPLRMEDLSPNPGELLVHTPEKDAIFNAKMVASVLASMVRNLPEPTA
jgi:hypothetical protein